MLEVLTITRITSIKNTSNLVILSRERYKTKFNYCNKEKLSMRGFFLVFLLWMNYRTSKKLCLGSSKVGVDQTSDAIQALAS